jgi:hypothetical protein
LFNKLLEAKLERNYFLNKKKETLWS